MTATVVLWDFDGTIAERPGLWSSCMLDVLDELGHAHGHTIDTFEPYLRSGFPWQDTTVDRRHLADPDAWWAALSVTLGSAYRAAGVPDPLIDDAVGAVRERFRDPSAWRVIPEAVAALQQFRDDGAVQAVLSNHVPELPQLVDDLGLGGYFERVFTSAAIGWEKPNAGIFTYALTELGHPDDVWLIGDNPVADVEGATAAGIRPVLVEGSYLVNGGVTHAEAVRLVREG